MQAITSSLTQSVRLGKKTRSYLATTALTATGLLALASPAMADNWTDLQGSGFSTDVSIPDTTNITQYVDIAKARGDLDITENHTVNIFQGGPNAIFAAWDIEGDPTYIMGRLNANGQVFIFDQNGVIFGKNSVVNVGSIIASTGQIEEASLKLPSDFAKLTIESVGQGGNIILDGTINVADAGIAAFVAPTIKNSGVINAKLGKVAFASGEKVTLDLYGDDLVNIAVDDKLADALIENSGTVNAEGGVVTMTAQAAKDVTDNIINMKGVVDVSSVSVQGGKIVLSGGSKGKVNVSGKLNASGTSGGSVKVTGQDIDVLQSADLWANGGLNGNGGDVSVLAKNNTWFRGRASAMGGALGGNGGFVELSADNELAYDGSVSTLALNGISGSFLLDPLYAFIHSGTLNSSNPTNRFISADSLATDLANNANVTVQATNYIDVGVTAPSAGVGTGVVDVSTGTTTTYTYAAINPSNPGHVIACGGPAAASNPHCMAIPNVTQILTGGNLVLESMLVNFNKDLIMGTGSVTVNAPTLNLNSRISGKSVIGGVATLLEDSRLIGAAQLTTVNVISPNALINQGISFVQTGGTVNVGAGTYEEQVLIGKNLTLNGANAGIDPNTGVRGAETIIKAPDSMAANFTSPSNNRGVVHVTDADNVIIDGVEVEGDHKGSTNDRMVGIGYFNAGGEIKNSIVHGVTDSTFNGNQRGNAIYAYNLSGAAKALNITNNEVYDFQKNGITLNGANITGTIKGNHVTGQGITNLNAQNGIQVGYGAVANVQDNTISGIGYSPAAWSASSILIFDAGAGTQVRGNTITGTGIDLGVSVVSTENAVIRNNVITGSGYGVLVDGGNYEPYLSWGVTGGSDGASISGNTINASVVDAINLYQVDDATISNNTVEGATGNGIYTDASNNVVITENSVKDTIRNNIWVDNGNNATITRNETSGTAAHAGIALRNVTGATISENTVTNAGYGLYADGNTTGVEAHGNSVTNITHALVWNQGTPETYDASGNYWGAADEAAINGKMWGAVDFTPYLALGTDTNLGVKGFQGDHSDLFVTTLGQQTQSGGRINEAIQALADGSLTGANRTVTALAGNYAEDVTVDKSMKLKGQQAGVNARPAASRGAETTLAGHIMVNPGVNGLTIDGFTIENQGTNVLGEIASIYLNNNVSNISVLNTRFDGNNISGSRGIVTSIAGIDNLLVRFSDFQNLATGVYINPNAANIDIQQNDFENNVVGVSVDGHARIDRNRFLNNSFEGLGIGGTADVVDNTFRDNGQHIGYYNGAGPDLILTGSGNKFFVNGSLKEVEDMVLADFFALEDSVTHKMDNAGYGLIRFDNGAIYVTTNTLGIQQGIDVAATGDEVHVDNGTYEENLLIDKSIKLTGHGTTLKYDISNDGPGRGIVGNLVTVTADDVNIDPFTFDGGNVANYGLNASGADNLVVDGNEYLNFLVDAIHVENSLNVSILNNNIHDITRYAVFATDSDDFKAKGNTIDNANVGILVVKSDDARIGGAGIERNTITNTADGIAVRADGDTADGAIVENNKIDGTTRTGMYLDNTTGIQIKDNVIDNSGRYSSIYVYKGSNATVGGNVLNHSDETGIFLHGVGGVNTVSGNTIDNTGETLYNSDGLNTGDAIRADGTAGLKISGNFIGTNGLDKSVNGDGIFVKDSAKAEISFNQITNTKSPAHGKGSGIHVDNGDGAQIFLNKIWDTDWDGIRIVSSDDADIMYNDIDDVERTGIFAGAAKDVDIYNNSVDTAKNDGIGVQNIQNVTVTGNWVGVFGGADNIGQKGITVTTGSNALISANIVANTKGDGIFADNIQSKGTADYAVTIGLNGVYNVGGNGIYVGNLRDQANISGEGRALISLNLVNTTGADGIHVKNSEADILLNAVDVTGGDGIELEGANDSNVWLNAIGVLGGAENINGDGVYVNKSAYTSVMWNAITNTKSPTHGKGSGVHIDQSDNATLFGNLIWNVDWDGVRLFSSDDAQIRNNIINATGRTGIYLGLGEDIVVDGNIIDDTQNDGIGAEKIDNLTISDNKVGVFGGANNIRRKGISVTYGSNAVIDGNDVHNTKSDGIYVEKTKSAGLAYYAAKITDNHVYKAGRNGINVFDLRNQSNNAGRVLIWDNDVEETGIDGIHVNKNGADILWNQVNETGTKIVGDGIELEESNDSNVKFNRIGLKGGNENINGDGIFVNNSDGARVYWNRIAHTNSQIPASQKGSGVQVYESDDVKIVGNKIWDVEWDGIRLQGIRDILVKGNNIDDVTRTGIYAEIGEDVEMDGNTIDDVGHDGIRTYGINGLDITDNWIGVFGGWNNIGKNGIYVYNGKDVLIEDNHVHNAKLDGIYVHGVKDKFFHPYGVKIIDNHVNKVGGNGIYVDELYDVWGNKGDGHVLVLDNNVEKVDKDGIHIRKAEADVLWNKVNDTGRKGIGDGIELEYADDSNVMFNKIGTEGGNRNINGDGIFINNSDDVNVFWNKITETDSNAWNKGSGIQVYRSDDVDVYGNKIWDVDWDGIRVEKSDDILIKKNDIWDVTRTGIYAANGEDIRIIRNDIDRTGWHGIHTDDVDDLLIKKNKIGTDAGSNNIGKHGIFVDGGSNVDIIRNKVENARWDGIHVENVDGGYGPAPTFALTTLLAPSSGWGLRIIGNKVKHSGDDGIEVKNVGDTLIKNNTVKDSDSVGILVSGFENGLIKVAGNKVKFFDTGMRFEAGTIDLTGKPDKISNGKTGILFRPNNYYYGPNGLTVLNLVDDDGLGSTPYVPGVEPTNFAGTLGAQVFRNISGQYVKLANNAFWDFDNNVPFWIDARYGDYDGIVPSSTGFILSSADAATLESKMFHYPDGQLVGKDIGIFFFDRTPFLTPEELADIDESQFIRSFAAFNGDTTGLNIRITGLPSTGFGGNGGAGGNGSAFNNITPFAGNGGNGGTNPADLNNINTAAGGSGGNGGSFTGNGGTGGNGGSNPQDIEPAAGGAGQDTGCWGDALTAAGNGQAVNVVYGGSMDDALSAAASCGGGTL